MGPTLEGVSVWITLRVCIFCISWRHCFHITRGRKCQVTYCFWYRVNFNISRHLFSDDLFAVNIWIHSYILISTGSPTKIVLYLRNSFIQKSKCCQYHTWLTHQLIPTQLRREVTCICYVVISDTIHPKQPTAKQT